MGLKNWSFRDGFRRSENGLARPGSTQSWSRSAGLTIGRRPVRVAASVQQKRTGNRCPSLMNRLSSPAQAGGYSRSGFMPGIGSSSAAIVFCLRNRRNVSGGEEIEGNRIRFFSPVVLGAFEGRFVRDQIDHLSLNDHVAERIHLAATLQASPDSSWGILLLGCNSRDFQFVIHRFVFDFFFLGDSLEDEMFLEQRLGFFENVFSKRILTRGDFRFGKSAGTHFHHGAIKFASGLPPQQVGWQFPVGRLGQDFTDLLPNLLALSVLKSALPRLRESVLQVSRLSQFPTFSATSAWSTPSSRLTSRISNSSSTVFATQFFVVGEFADLNGDGFLVVGFGTDQQFVEALDGGVR